MIDDSAVIRRRGANQSNLAFFLLCTIRIPPHRAPIDFFFLFSIEFFYDLEKNCICALFFLFALSV